MTRETFFKVLFDETDHTCFGKTIYEVTCTRIFSISGQFLRPHTEEAQFFSINPTNFSRRDSNVETYRNILLEFDSIPLDEQLELVKTIPHSTVVFSGGKSHHVIISLEEPLKNREEYDDLVKAVYNKVPEADKTAKNPSRFSRAPGFVRDNGQEQKLLEVLKRIPNDDVYKWAGVNPETLGTRVLESKFVAKHKMLPVRALSFLQYGAPIGRWNQELFIASCDMFSVGYSKEEVMELCQRVTGYLDRDDKKTIESARKNVYND